MSFSSVRKRIGQLLNQGFRPILLSFFLVFSMGAFAQWQDPLNTPAISSAKAEQTLMLDVVRAGVRLVAVGAHGNIVLSDDDGKSWQQAKVPVSVTLTAVSFPSSQQGWAVGHDGVIVHSSDGGLTWQKQFDGYLANKAMVAAAKANKLNAESKLDDALESANQLAIEEAELALENLTYALEDAIYDEKTGSTKPFLDTWFYDNKTGFALGAYGMMFKTRDGGQSWQDWSAVMNNADRLHLNAITKVANRSLIVVGEQGMILRSDDMGDSWHSLPSPYEGSLFGSYADGEKIVVYGLRGKTYRSQDGGVNWQAVTNNNQQALMASLKLRSGQVVLIGNAGSKVVLNKELNFVSSATLLGRIAYAGAAQAANDEIIVAGEKGVTILPGATQAGEQK